MAVSVHPEQTAKRILNCLAALGGAAEYEALRVADGADLDAGLKHAVEHGWVAFDPPILALTAEGRVFNNVVAWTEREPLCAAAP